MTIKSDFAKFLAAIRGEGVFAHPDLPGFSIAVTMPEGEEGPYRAVVDTGAVVHTDLFPDLTSGCLWVFGLYIAERRSVRRAWVRVVGSENEMLGEVTGANLTPETAGKGSFEIISRHKDYAIVDGCVPVALANAFQDLYDKYEARVS